jgi:peptide/nickel transport system substrate-binding protein
VIAPLSDGNHVVAEPSQFDLGLLDSVSSLPNTVSSLKPSLNFLQLEFDVAAPLTSVTAVREGIAHAIDRPLLEQQTLGSIEPNLVLDEDHLAVPTQTSYATSTASGSYDTADLDSTADLLKSAGYHKSPAGLYVDGQGKPLTVRMAVETGDPWIAQVGEGIVDQLQQVGITVITVPVDGPAGLDSALAAGAYDMALVTRTASPYQSQTEAWYSYLLGANGPGGSQNWSNFTDAQVDQLFSQATGDIQDLDPVTAAAVYAQIDDQLWDQMVALPLFQEPALVANGVQLGNVQYNPSVDGLLWNLQDWSSLVPKRTSPSS